MAWKNGGAFAEYASVPQEFSSLGADHVIDYQKQSFLQGSERYDVILDVASNLWFDVYLHGAPRIGSAHADRRSDVFAQ